jgi:hypothetical protein
MSNTGIQIMFVFSYFREFAAALHLAISEDLCNWTDISADGPILEPQLGDKYWRDPFIIRAQDGIFHLLCTNSWNSQSIDHASSQNLLEWSDQEILPLMEGYSSAKNTWAPEAVYDNENQQYRIFWSSTVEDAFPYDLDKTKAYRNHRIYSCTTPDFKIYSKSELFFDPGFNCIDASIGYHDGLYLMAFKDERGDNSYFPDELARKHILIATATSLNGPWDVQSTPITPSSYDINQENDKQTWTEAACVFWNDSAQEWWVFYEYFRSMRYGAVKSADGIHWQNMDVVLHFPEFVKHGTVFKVNDEEIIRSLKEKASNE